MVSEQLQRCGHLVITEGRVARLTSSSGTLSLAVRSSREPSDMFLAATLDGHAGDTLREHQFVNASLCVNLDVSAILAAG